jgi:mono/diheme cytochrome c family protein
MTSRNSLRLIGGAVIVAAAVACSRSATVGSPGTMASPAPATNKASAMPAGVTAASIADGKTLYEAPSSNCSRCHGPEAKGTNRAPNLTDSTWVHIDGSYPEIVRIINAGVPASEIKGPYQFPMGPKGRSQTLTDAQVNSIAAYIWSLSHAH